MNCVKWYPPYGVGREQSALRTFGQAFPAGEFRPWLRAFQSEAAIEQICADFGVCKATVHSVFSAAFAQLFCVSCLKERQQALRELEVLRREVEFINSNGKLQRVAKTARANRLSVEAIRSRQNRGDRKFSRRSLLIQGRACLVKTITAVKTVDGVSYSIDILHSQPILSNDALVVARRKRGREWEFFVFPKTTLLQRHPSLRTTKKSWLYIPLSFSRGHWTQKHRGAWDLLK